MFFFLISTRENVSVHASSLHASGDHFHGPWITNLSRDLSEVAPDQARLEHFYGSCNLHQSPGGCNLLLVLCPH